MTLRQYLVIMSVATILCWIAWGIVLINVDPNQAPAIGFAFFYLSLFLAFVGTFSIIFFIWHHFFSKKDYPMFRYVQKSFRQAIFAAGLLVFILFLRGAGLIRLWNLLPLIGFFIILFLFNKTVRSTQERQNSNNPTQAL